MMIRNLINLFATIGIVFTFIYVLGIAFLISEIKHAKEEGE